MALLDRHRTAGVLYAEDFDDPPPAPPPPPPPPEPTYDSGQLEAAQQTAYAEGMAAGEAQMRGSLAQTTLLALAAIANGMAEADADAARHAEACADALAGLLLACLRRALPELCRLHGVGEARAVARAVLPGLLHEPQVTVRAAPATAEAVAAEIVAAEPELAARLRIQPMPQLPPGDVRIAWADGQVQRDVGALWRAIAGALEPAGLNLPTDAAPALAGAAAAVSVAAPPTPHDAANDEPAAGVRAADTQTARAPNRERDHVS
jgi:flagellar assembly protein FliH